MFSSFHYVILCYSLSLDIILSFSFSISPYSVHVHVCRLIEVEHKKRKLWILKSCYHYHHITTSPFVSKQRRTKMSLFQNIRLYLFNMLSIIHFEKCPKAKDKATFVGENHNKWYSLTQQTVELSMTTYVYTMYVCHNPMTKLPLKICIDLVIWYFKYS